MATLFLQLPGANKYHAYQLRRQLYLSCKGFLKRSVDNAQALGHRPFVETLPSEPKHHPQELLRAALGEQQPGKCRVDAFLHRSLLPTVVCRTSSKRLKGATGSDSVTSDILGLLFSRLRQAQKPAEPEMNSFLPEFALQPPPKISQVVRQSSAPSFAPEEAVALLPLAADEVVAQPQKACFGREVAKQSQPELTAACPAVDLAVVSQAVPIGELEEKSSAAVEATPLSAALVLREDLAKKQEQVKQTRLRADSCRRQGHFSE